MLDWQLQKDDEMCIAHIEDILKPKYHFFSYKVFLSKAQAKDKKEFRPWSEQSHYWTEFWLLPNLRFSPPHFYWEKYLEFWYPCEEFYFYEYAQAQELSVGKISIFFLLWCTFYFAIWENRQDLPRHNIPWLCSEYVLQWRNPDIWQWKDDLIYP